MRQAVEIGVSGVAAASIGECIPSSTTGLFADHERCRFAVGVVAVNDRPARGLDAAYKAYLALRGRVYAHEMHWMPVEELNPDGTESDADDARSVHVAVFENHGEFVRVVAAMRLICKSSEAPEALPVERLYPEAFRAASPPFPCAEVSRLICRHEDRLMQLWLKWPLFTVGLLWALDHGFDAAYGALEPELEQSLTRQGLGLQKLAQAKFVPSFNAVKAPIRVDLDALGRRLGANQPELLAAAGRDGFVYLDAPEWKDR